MGSSEWWKEVGEGVSTTIPRAGTGTQTPKCGCGEITVLAEDRTIRLERLKAEVYTQLSSLGSGFSYIGSFQRQNWSQAIICITSLSEVWAPTCLSCFSPVVLYQVIIVSVAFQTSWWWVGRTGQRDPRTRSQGCLQHCPICCSVENTALKIKVEALPKQDLFFKKRKQL